MRTKTTKTRILVTLFAIVLSVTFSFSNIAVAKADNTTEKRLVQNSDDWTIFKYYDASGEPQFDVKYQNKTVEQLQAEGYEMQYRLLVKVDETMELSVFSWYTFDNLINENQISRENESRLVQFRIINNSEEIGRSYTFYLYVDKLQILSANYEYGQYGDIYDLTTNVPNTFKVTLKVNECIEGNLSIYSESPYEDINEYLLGHPATNISYQNYNEYSIISFDMDVSPTVKASRSGDIDYIIHFNNITGINSNSNLEGLIVTVRTPAESGPSDPDKIPVSLIRITASTSKVEVGKTVKLSAGIAPFNATDKTVTWLSSDNSIATVSNDGTVTAKVPGRVVIRALANDGSNVEGSYTLNIVSNSNTEPTTSPTLVNTISITGKNSVVAGKNVSLTANVNADAANKSITWSSSNTKYATVNANGVVTTKPAGAGKSVTITAKAKDGSGKIATFKLNIAKIPVTKIKLSAKKSVKAGKKITVKVTINPTNATDKKVTFQVTNKKYAKINSKGVLTTKKAGKGKTVTVTAKVGGKKATIKIKIK